MSADRSAERTESRRGLVGRVLAGRYRVTRMVSAGANSLVVDATDSELDRQVTVKLVRPEWAESPDFQRKFTAAMRSASALSHPNLAAVYDWGEEVIGKRTTVYVASEYLAGGSLRDLFDRGRHLSPSQALMVGLEACRGLDYAHRRGLVHSEVTPSKLVFGDDRRLRIVDFALARLLGEPYWTEPATVPTHVARYCSPEQALAQPIDGKSDVYSLALVLVEAVTGSVPFAARSTVATVSARVGKLMPVSADLGSLASVLERAGRPDPEDRSTAAEFGRALVKAAEKLPRPAPIPILAVGPLTEDPTTMRRPNDPTGGITRPPSEAGPAPQPVPAPAPTETAAPPTVEEPAEVERPAAVVPAGPEDPTAPIAASASAAAAATTAAAGGTAVPRLYDGDADRTVDELAELAAVSGAPEVQRQEAAAPATAPPVPATAPAPAADAEPAPRRRRRWLAWVGGLLVLGALAALGYLAYALFRTPTHEVPDLVGRTEADAAAMTTEFDWELDVQRERSDEEPDPGQIIRTAPAAGERLAEGEPFLVVVSEGPEFRPLPDVTGATLADAETALAELDLTALPPTQEHHEEVPAGSVISWSVPAQPALTAGGEVLPDTEVALVVSSGPAPRTVPNIVNMPLDQATSTLAELRLQIKQATAQFSNDVPAGAVLVQNPAPNTQLARGSTVYVRLSKGPDLRRLPRLAGLTLREARQQLRQAGLRVGSLLGSTQGVVVEANVGGNPVARGDRLPRGTPVDLVLF
jgi:beta-lactam-binding protein with PASTA domain